MRSGPAPWPASAARAGRLWQFSQSRLALPSSLGPGSARAVLKARRPLLGAREASQAALHSLDAGINDQGPPWNSRHAGAPPASTKKAPSEWPGGGAQVLRWCEAV
jgi:hypothetical protein